MEAIAQGNSPHALRARELCQQAAQAEAIRLEAEANADKATTGACLSMEAVAAHTVQQGLLLQRCFMQKNFCLRSNFFLKKK